MSGWAQLLHDVVERRLRPGDTTDLLAPSWDTMFEQALATVMQQMVATRLEALTPEQFVTTYRSARGDVALLAELDQLVDARAREAHRERVMLRLATDARVAGRLRLGELGTDETLDIGLFDPSDPSIAGWRFRADVQRRPLHRVVRVRTTAPASGEAQVVTDTWTGAVWAERWRTRPVPPMTTVRIGSRVPGASDLRPELTLHAPVVLAPGDGPVLTPPQIVGYVRTLDGRLLLDAPDRRA